MSFGGAATDGAGCDARPSVVAMWLVVTECALVLFLVAGVTFYVVTYIRKSKTVKSTYDPNGYLAHFDQPQVPPPEWVDWTDDDGDGTKKPGPER